MEVKITATDATKKGVASARQGLNSLAKGVGIVGAAVGGLGLGLMVKQSLDLNDALAKNADRLGISTQALAGFHHQAGLAGGSAQGMNTTLQMMNRNVSDAANGVGLAKDAIKDLGLSAEELRKAGPEQAFIQIVERLEGVDNSLDRTNIAMDIFGRQGAAVLNITSESLRDAAIEAEALGLAISRTDAAKIEAANDAMLRMQGAVQGAVNTLTIELAPIITAVVDKFTAASKEADGFRDGIVSFTETALIGAARVGDAFHGWQLIFRGIKVAWMAESAAIMMGFEQVDAGITAVINAGIAEINGLIRTINFIPGVTVPLLSGVQPSETLAGMADLAKEHLSEAIDEFGALSREGLPSDRIKAWITEVKEAATLAGQEIEAQALSRIETSGIDQPAALPAGEVDEKERADLQKRLDALIQSQLTERELLLVNYEQNQILLDSSLNQKLLSEQDHLTALAQLNQEHQTSLTELDRQESEARIAQAEAERNAKIQTANNLANSFDTISKIVSSRGEKQSRKDFEVQKAADTASAIMNTYTGATKALATGGVTGIVQAALVIAYGLAQVSKIQSQSFSGGASGGGGGATSAGAGAGAGPITTPTFTEPTQQQPQQGVTLVVHGNIVGEDAWVEDNLIPLLQNFNTRNIDVTVEGQ